MFWKTNFSSTRKRTFQYIDNKLKHRGSKPTDIKEKILNTEFLIGTIGAFSSLIKTFTDP